MNRKAAAAIALAGLLGGLASACLTVALLGANFLSTAVDRAPVREHIAEAFAASELDLRDHLRTDTKRGAHQYNDCLILLMIADERTPPLQRALSPLAAGVKDLGPCVALREFMEGRPVPLGPSSRYHRYLHGHVALDAPLIATFSLPHLRMLFDLVMFAGLAGLLTMCVWRLLHGLAAMKRAQPPADCTSVVTRALFGLAAGIALVLFWGLQFYGMSLSHFPSDAILIGYVYLLVLADLRRWPTWMAALAHGGFGTLTAYFEFLTGGIPLGFALIFYGYAAGAATGGSGSVVVKAIAAAVAFAVGIAAAFAVKLIATVAIFGTPVIHDFFGELSYRVAGANVRPWDVAFALLSASHYLGAGWRLLGAAMLAAPIALFAAALIRIARRGRPIRLTSVEALLCLSTFSVWGWWLIFEQHTYQHNFFMVRIGVGPVFSASVLAACVYAKEIQEFVLLLLKGAVRREV